MIRLHILALAVIFVMPAFAEGNPPPSEPPDPPARDRNVSDGDGPQSQPGQCCLKSLTVIYCTFGETPATVPVLPHCSWMLHPADDPWALWREK